MSNISKCLKEYNKINTTSFTSILTRTLLSSILAANGLINNSLTSLIPSMLISPIGSLLIDLSIFGVSKSLSNSSKILNSIGTTSLIDMILLLLLIIIITILLGALYGYIYTTYYQIQLPTREMENRDSNYKIIESAVIALLCAVAFPIAYRKKDVATLISIGIATSLLPPLTNIGVTIGTFYNKPEYYTEPRPVSSTIKNGFLLFSINAFALSLASYLYINNRCLNFKGIKIAKEADFI